MGVLTKALTNVAPAAPPISLRMVWHGPSASMEPRSWSWSSVRTKRMFGGAVEAAEAELRKWRRRRRRRVVVVDMVGVLLCRRLRMVRDVIGITAGYAIET